MQPLQLKLSAFGPFAATETIDFRQLGTNPFFLINGSTGAGKTSILDGICFALYGSTTGNEREAAQMRCDYAAADVLTQVSLEFALNKKRYRILREPEQLRPKARGEGTTIHKATATLYQVDDETETLLVAKKVTEANQQIEALTGLSVAQFRQVMVLPQGEFRRLLLASSTDREAIFSQLFQTQIYKRIETSLFEKAAGVRKAREASQNVQQGILASASLTSEAALNESLAALKPEHQHATEAKRQASLALQTSKDAVQAAEQLIDQQHQLQQAQHQQAELAKQQPTITALQAEYRQAQQADQLKPVYTNCLRAAKTQQNAQHHVQACQSQLETSQQQVRIAEQKAEHNQALASKIHTYTTAIAELKSYQPRVALLAQAQQKHHASINANSHAQQQQQQAETALHTLEKRLHATRQQQADGRTHINNKVNAPQQLQSIELQLKQALRLAQHHSQLKALQQDCNQQEGLVAAADKALRQQHSTTKTLELAWHRGQAAILAAELQQDKPCPVCGSAAHPQPAISHQLLPSQTELEAAKTQLEQASQKQQKSALKLVTLNERTQGVEAQFKTLTQQMASTLPSSVAELEPLQQQAQKDANTLKQLQNDDQKLERLQQALTQQIQTSQQTLATANSEYATAMADSQVAIQRLQTAESELPEHYRPPGALSNAIDNAIARQNQLQEQLDAAAAQWEAAKVSLEKANAKLDAAQDSANNALKDAQLAADAWQQALATSTFVDQAAFEVANRTAQQQQALQQQVQRYEQQVAEAKGVIKSLQQLLADQAVPDLNQLNITLQQQAAALAEAEQAFTEKDRQLNQLQNVATSLAKAKQTSQHLDVEYAVVGTLADVANGRTGNRISLQRFVLSVLLDDVLLAASIRLKRMSKGRYELYRQQQRSKGGGASGLELVVEDAYNGRQRPVATLSGGESFMAALSLALGLSDVVQAHSGGIKLDTLFVDEGFGSLDPESLDLAVNTLLDLQASGRMVGVISHVPELKERINVRLDVIANRQGSYTHIVC